MDAMPVEINLYLATHIMGWVYHETEDGLASDEQIPDYRDKNGKFIMLASNWDPLFDLNQVVMIEKEMREHGYQILLYRSQDVFVCSFQHSIHNKRVVIPPVRKETLSEAVCHAAIQAHQNRNAEVGL